MTKTQRPNETSKTNTAAPNTPAPSIKRVYPTAHTLLALTLERATPDESEMIYQILSDCSSDKCPLTMAEYALHTAGLALGIRFHVETITEHVKLYNDIALLTLTRRWLLSFIECILEREAQNQLNPDDVIEYAEMELLRQEGNYSNAREVLSTNPAAVAKEIRAAVAAYPDLLSDAS